MQEQDGAANSKQGNKPDTVSVDQLPGSVQRQYLKWLYGQRKKLLDIDRKLDKQLRKRETLAIDESRIIVEDIGQDLSDSYDPVMLGLDSSILSHLVDNLGTIYEDIGKSTMLDLDVVESFDDDLITVVARLTRQKRNYSCPIIIKQKELNFKTIDYDPSVTKQVVSRSQQSQQEKLDILGPIFEKINVPRKSLTPAEKETINLTLLSWAEEKRLFSAKELKNLPYEFKSSLFKLAKLKKISLTRVSINGKRGIYVKLERYKEEKDKYREQTIVY